MKFLVFRAFHGTEEERQEPEFVELIRAANPQEYACAQAVAAYLKEQRGHPLTQESQAYLAVHIRRVNANYKCES